jgi:single-stranded-DNA-specific exonuclease
MAAAMPPDETFGLVLAKQGWHPGVVGIVASRIVEEFARPAVLVALEGETGKGSGRSISAFDLHGALGECSDLLLRYGGHRAAAGVTVSSDRIDAFARRFNDVARARLTRDDLRPELRIDAEIPLGAANAELEGVLRHFEPFGVGNPSPTFATRDVRTLSAPRLIGKDGIRVRLAGATGGEIEAIGWGMAHLAPQMLPGRPLDVAFRLERDEYQGESRLQAKLADVVVR